MLIDTIQDKYAVEFIEHLINIGAIEQRNIIIEGRHPKLSEYQKWYKGFNEWHIYVGTENGQSKLKEKYSSGLAKMMMEDIANNFANERTTITIPNKDQQVELDNYMLDFFSSWGKFVEKYQALGIGATIVTPTKIVYDGNNQIIKEQDTKLKISKISASRIIPITVEDDEVTEVLFVRSTTRKVTLQIHLKQENGNYIVAEVEGARQDKASDSINFNYNNCLVLQLEQTPLFQIWHPNVADNEDEDIELGTSRLSNAITWIKLTDEILTSFFTEFKNGKKKKFISADMIRVDEHGAKELLLDDDEFLLPSDRDSTPMIQEFNGELRVESHIRGINTAISGATKACGLGAGSFTFDSMSSGRPIQTATGQILKETDKYRTILKEESQAVKNLKKLVMAIAYVNNNLIASGITFTTKMEEINVIFDDNIVEDTETKKRLMLDEIKAGVIAEWEYRVENKDEDEETAKKFIQDNQLLADKFTNRIVNKITPYEQTAKLLVGEKSPLVKQCVEMWESNNTQASPMDYWDQDETETNSKKEKEQDPEQEQESDK